jgi:HPt (histidine-containing phosphotransfer) domain-containing protein
VHTARGVSGNIGARAQEKAAAALELAIRGNAESETLIEAFDAAMTEMTGELRRALGAGDEPQAGAEPVNLKEAGPQLDGLANLLEAADSDAVDYLAAQAATLRAALGARSFGEIEKAVNDFDFEAALAKLRACAEARDAERGQA